jgi:hypothetical protein
MHAQAELYLARCAACKCRDLVLDRGRANLVEYDQTEGSVLRRTGLTGRGRLYGEPRSMARICLVRPLSKFLQHDFLAL